MYCQTSLSSSNSCASLLSIASLTKTSSPPCKVCLHRRDGRDDGDSPKGVECAAHTPALPQSRQHGRPRCLRQSARRQHHDVAESCDRVLARHPSPPWQGPCHGRMFKFRTRFIPPRDVWASILHGQHGQHSSHRLKRLLRAAGAMEGSNIFERLEEATVDQLLQSMHGYTGDARDQHPDRAMKQLARMPGSLYVWCDDYFSSTTFSTERTFFLDFAAGRC